MYCGSKKNSFGKNGTGNANTGVGKTTGQNSTELSRNLSREGRTVGNGEAAESREILQKYGVNIDNVANGIPLAHPRPHNITHRAGFHETVNTRLTSVVNDMKSLNYGRKAIRSALRKELRKIGREILKQVEEL